MTKKSVQAIKNRKEKFSTVLVGCGLIILLVFFILYTAQNALHYLHINADELYEYSGTFELEEINRTRNTIYRFVLPNGDTITANPDIMQNNRKLEKCSQLHFIYTAPQNNVLFLTPNAVAISASDSVTHFLSANESMTAAKENVSLGVFFACLVLSINILYWCFLVGITGRKRKNNSKT